MAVKTAAGVLGIQGAGKAVSLFESFPELHVRPGRVRPAGR